MTKRQKYYDITLFDCGGDVSKQWYVAYYIIDEKGNKKRIRRSDGLFKIKDKQQRYEAARNIIAALEAENKSNNEKVNILNSQFKRLLEHKKQILAKNSARSYDTLSKYLNDFAESHHPQLITDGLQVVDAAFIHAFRDWVIKNPMSGQLSTKTVNNYIALLNAALVFLTESGVIDARIPKVKKLKVKSDPRAVFSRPHMAKIIAYAKESYPDLYLKIAFLFYTCNRPEALRNLRIGDIDFDRRLIRFSADNQKGGRAMMQPISNAFWDELQAFNLEQYPKHYYLFAKGAPGQEPAFNGYFARLHKKMLAELDLERFGYTMYAWKHTGAIYLYEAIRDVKRVSEHLFHSDISTTVIYLQRYGVVFGKNEIIEKQPKLG